MGFSSARRQSNRYGRYRLYVALLAVLAIALFVQAWRQVTYDVAPINNSSDVLYSAGEGVGEALRDPLCEWQEDGPQLYVLQHSDQHPQGDA